MNGKRVGILSLIAIVLAASVLIAAASDGRDRHKTIVIGDDDETLTISMQDGSVLRIITDDGDEQVVEIDLSVIGQIVEEAMAGVDEALAGLSDLELDLQLDGLDRFSIYDGEDRVEIDIESIFDQVGEVLEEAFDSGFEAWEDAAAERDDRVADREHRHFKAEDLRSELDELREQIADMQKELRQLRQRQRH